MRQQRHLDATEEDLRREQVALQRQLSGTFHEIWQNRAAEGNAEAALRAEKYFLQVSNCQAQWIGYRAECCKGFTSPVAVPIGCNHRLCPLCCYRRSQAARKRIKTMFDRLTHPALITLTVPNLETIRKHDFTKFRQRTRKFLALHKGWIKGGVYSLETTYNRTAGTWHIHAHILVDMSHPLPTKKDKIELAGEQVYALTAIKQRLEFDWLRLWGGAWGRAARKDANAQTKAGEVYSFENWVAIGRIMRLKEWRDGAYRPIEGLSDGEILTRTLWNAANRRVIDIRPVVDRDGAAREVLKYITKVAAFSDVPAAVEAFCAATRGARLIQTFGTWYGVKLDEEITPDELKDWGEMTCTCGLNIWARMGVFYRSDVEMDPSGRWHLKHPLNHSSLGTVPRPTIRALDAREEI